MPLHWQPECLNVQVASRATPSPGLSLVGTPESTRNPFKFKFWRPRAWLMPVSKYLNYSTYLLIYSRSDSGWRCTVDVCTYNLNDSVLRLASCKRRRGWWSTAGPRPPGIASASGEPGWRPQPLRNTGRTPGTPAPLESLRLHQHPASLWLLTLKRVHWLHY